MKKMTVRELECKLYIETLREKYQNREFMFTALGERELEHIKDWSEERKKQFKKNDRLLGVIQDSLFSRHIPNCKNKDFVVALLFSCWLHKFSVVNSEIASFIKSQLICELNVDFDKICDSVIAEEYTPYLIHNRQSDDLSLDCATQIICGYDGWDGKNVLEIDTDFYKDSTKVFSDEIRYIVSYILRDLSGAHSKILRTGDDYSRSEDNKYQVVIAQLNSCREHTSLGLDTFVERLNSYAHQSSGRIILLDAERFIASDEGLAFRKKIVEENLLDIYISGHDFNPDVYILHTYSQCEDTPFHIVCMHENSVSINDNFLTLHNKVSKEDLRSLGYNINAVSDLLGGQEGRAYHFRDLFGKAKNKIEERTVSGKHPVFQMKDFDSHNFIQSSSTLDSCEITGTYQVLSDEKVIFFIGDDRIHVSYINASEENPVYVGHQFLVVDLNTKVVDPNYLYVLYSKGVFDKVFSAQPYERNYFRYTDCVEDFYVSPVDKICSIGVYIQIPSLAIQHKEIADAQFISASAVDRERALEMLLAEKTWLNEEHIRNIKHRIGNELLPVKNDVDALHKLFDKHPEGLTLDTIRGKDEKVSEILSRLSRCVSQVNESLLDLTRTVEKGNLKPVDVVAVVKDFARTAKNTSLYKLMLNIPDECIYVNGSANMINVILRNIVNNAERHGFVDKSANDYAIEISINYDGNNNCVLTVKNNGASMSEFARESYFKRGSVAGTTGHSGIGGADVKDTVNAMGGEVTLPRTEDDYWTVCVRISLPIINTEKI